MGALCCEVYSLLSPVSEQVLLERAGGPLPLLLHIAHHHFLLHDTTDANARAFRLLLTDVFLLRQLLRVYKLSSLHCYECRFQLKPATFSDLMPATVPI